MSNEHTGLDPTINGFRICHADKKQVSHIIHKTKNVYYHRGGFGSHLKFLFRSSPDQNLT